MPELQLSLRMEFHKKVTSKFFLQWQFKCERYLIMFLKTGMKTKIS